MRGRHEIRSALLAAALAGAIAGCNSYRITQSNDFANDDGKIVRVDYGQAEKDHVNKFRSPANGREFEFRSKLVVDVAMPDGDDFTAWQCMNFAGNGTAYKTDDEEWIFIASGFTCRILHLDEKTKKYRPAFDGVLCNTPYEAQERDTRWRKLKPGQRIIRKR